MLEMRTGSSKEHSPPLQAPKERGLTAKKFSWQTVLKQGSELRFPWWKLYP